MGWNLGLITVGCLLCAAALNAIILPGRFLSGGYTGLALIFHYVFPSLSVAWLYLLINVPSFALGWLYVGRRFFLYSLAGMAIFSLAVAWVDLPPIESDPLVCAVLGGIINGLGSGIILRSVGSAGGTDILSVILYQRFSLRPGNTVLAFNVLVLGAGFLLFPLDKLVYTLIYIFVGSRAVNLVVTGLSQRKAVIIVSPQWRTIADRILEELGRGVTFLHGEGAYSGHHDRVLYAVITFRELSRLKQAVRREDPKAFVVVHDTLEVMGGGVDNQPHW